MFGYPHFGIGRSEVILILAVIFILFGYKLPSVMRLMGRGAVDARHNKAEADRQLAIFVCSALLLLLISVLAMTLIGLLPVDG